MKQRLLCLLFGVLLLTAIAPGESVQDEDGNWWLTLSNNERLIFIDGFMNGLDLGHRFSYWWSADWMDRQDKKIEASNAIIDSLSKEQKTKAVKENIKLYKGMRKIDQGYRDRASQSLADAMDNFTKYFNDYIAGKSNTQFRDGLDNFYADYRNRSIAIKDAIWLVANEMSGMPRDSLDLMINNYRKNTKK